MAKILTSRAVFAANLAAKKAAAEQGLTLLVGNQGIKKEVHHEH